jgi:hypothetical protein
LEQYFVTLFRPRIIRIMSHSISVHEPSYVHPHSDESNGEAMRRKGESHGSTGSSNPSNREHVLGHATCTWTDALHKLQIVHIFSASSMLVYWCVLCQRSRESYTFSNELLHSFWHQWNWDPRHSCCDFVQVLNFTVTPKKLRKH